MATTINPGRGDDARAGLQQGEQEPDLRRPVPEHEPDPGPGHDVGGDGVGGGAEVAPRVPAALELERRGGRIEVEDLADAPTELGQLGRFEIGHLSLGSGRSAPLSATSA
jgi:hypothetical protein